MIRLQDLQSGLRDGESRPGRHENTGTLTAGFPHALEAMEKNHIRRVLDEHKRSMTKTAEALGISRSTLWRKLHDLDQQ
jgi:transcriptional regulator with PAS, ATPase and Fis domain